MTRFILDSGDINEYVEVSKLAKNSQYVLWGGTTNPTLIAKTLKDKKLTQQEALKSQKDIILDILKIVEGSVSAEVYADFQTTALDMVKQAEEIAAWDRRIHIKLPTTLEGFKARTFLRKSGIPTNNTLVFSQKQIFAICLHEKLIQEQYNPPQNLWPSFISPFVGRLDDSNKDGMMLVENGMKIKGTFDYSLWMLEASVRRIEHIQRGILSKTELITVPAKIYKEWLGLSTTEKDQLDTAGYAIDMKSIPYWTPDSNLSNINSIDAFETAIKLGRLDIHHPLTDSGLESFAKDWQEILK